MFKEISIKKYRGISSADIKDCRRINVFFGKNNCGKTSVLEAIFLLSGQSNPILPFNVNAFRGYTSLVSENDVRYIFYNLDTTYPIEIASEAGGRNLKISLIKSVSKTIDIQTLLDTNSKANEKYFGLKLSYEGNDSSEIIIREENSQKAKVQISKQYKECMMAEFLHPRMVVSELVANKLSKMITEKKKENILSVMRVIEPSVLDIVVANNTIMVDVGAERLLPVNFMGDGMVKVLMNIITIYECAGGVALIDEVDNGLHYSLMGVLWRTMIVAAIENDVQLFVTTHNIDSIKGLNEILQTKEFQSDILSAYKLIKESGGKNADILSALRYNESTLNYMINQEIELR